MGDDSDLQRLLKACEAMLLRQELLIADFMAGGLDTTDASRLLNEVEYLIANVQRSVSRFERAGCRLHS